MHCVAVHIERAAATITAIVMLAATLGAAQAAPPAQALPPALRDRVTAFWTTWKARDLAGMHAFYCPDYQARVPRGEYLKLQRLLRYPIVEFSISGAEIDGNRATVTVHTKNDVAAHPLGSFESDTRQVWLMTADGAWCKEDEPLLVPFPGPPGQSALSVQGR